MTPAPATAAPTRPAALLWDFDGTLADTEPLWIAAEYDLVGRLGGTWSDEHAHQLVGNSLVDSGSYILHAIDRPDLRPEWVVDQLVTRVIADLLRGDLPWRPGALALLEKARLAGIPCALVSTSYRVQLDAAMAALPPGSFTTSVAGDEVVRGKPHPEPYERACAELGVDPPPLHRPRGQRDRRPLRQRRGRARRGDPEPCPHPRRAPAGAGHLAQRHRPRGPGPAAGRGRCARLGGCWTMLFRTRTCRDR